MYIDTGIYDDGDLYQSTDGLPTSYIAVQELHYHRISPRINYTASVIPGAGESFKIFNIQLRVAQDSQQSFSHEAFVDLTTPSEFISPKINHLGSEFVIANVQLIAQRKRYQKSG